MNKLFILYLFALFLSLSAYGQTKIPRPNYKPAANGCGAQGSVIDYVPDFNFTEACNGHDICYGTCFKTKSECDLNFLAGMLQACDGSESCQMLATIYYDAVSGTETGMEAYASGQEEGCIECKEAVNFGDAIVIPYCGDEQPEVTLKPIVASGFGDYDILWQNGNVGGSMVVNRMTPTKSMAVTLVSRDYANGQTHSCKAQATVVFLPKDNCDEDPEEEWEVPIVVSKDPNDIIGPEGYGPAKMVSKFAPQTYTIRFENDPMFATAPAQVVKIRLPLHDNINPYSLRLDRLGFGRFSFQVPQNRTFYTSRYNVVDSLDVVVDVTAGIDPVKKEAFWILESKDPVTGLAPTDAMKGFLPVNDSTAIGEGFVSFTIRAGDETQTGDTLPAKASIIFDDNAAIETPPVFNTLDALPPSSNMVALPAVVSDTSFVVKWTGTDDNGGSGVKEYALYVSTNGNAYRLYEEGITTDSTTFVGKAGNTYCFFTLATDNTGNQESFKTICEGSVMISGGGTLPVTLLYFKGQKADKDVKLTWATVTEYNSKVFVVERSTDGSNFTDIGMINGAGSSSQLKEYSYLDQAALTRDVRMLYYRLRQLDNDGRFIRSGVVSLPVQRQAKEVAVHAYPNPFRHNITLQVVAVSATDQTDKVELYSLDGKMVYQKKIGSKGNLSVLLDNLPDLKPGIYLLKTIVNKQQYVIKMIRQ
ncbi:MAG TPA: T9SS type A sorting domain-containing protein [Flavisolibacter sp.]|nr:T9SS type A sorting domain-containing protein [Flavisolibacter sp.]